MMCAQPLRVFAVGEGAAEIPPQKIFDKDSAIKILLALKRDSCYKG
jgi:hypothetical protein